MKKRGRKPLGAEKRVSTTIRLHPKFKKWFMKYAKEQEDKSLRSLGKLIEKKFNKEYQKGIE